MRLNRHDFFESEETGLQICLIPGALAVILNWRGKGEFRSTPVYGDEEAGGEVLGPQVTDRPPFNVSGVKFSDTEALKQHLSSLP
jgi:hypothetical protein